VPDNGFECYRDVTQTTKADSFGQRGDYSCEVYWSKTKGGSMRKIAAFVLLLSTLCWAESNTGEYPINVHVTSSRWVVVPTTIGPQSAQKLNVIIEGKKYELEAEAKGRVALLSLGDYKAKLIEDIRKNPYESTQAYELQFSDKKTRKFFVIGQSE
jgi:hypothetical protein